MMIEESTILLDTPVGRLAVATDGSAVLSIRIATDRVQELAQAETPVAMQTINELEEYFAGKRKEFGIPIRMNGTAFQIRVWNELLKIPHGSVTTYGEIAARIGKPGAARAVGMACNRNPLLIVVPCHRVVGQDGSLTGYAAGTDKKRMLLELENGIQER
ncbi:MAG: methylated-DNA--[Bacteroidaceae bacterium]|nr:methylated-DNA--[protein]-cysteine S-methyltransferase [Bacteroidaceae bacterium]